MNRLVEIAQKKRQRVAEAKRAMPRESLDRLAFATRDGARPHALRSAVADPLRINIIAEFKRRSPSKGPIREGADPKTTAQQYERGGAAAVSVLTEADYFAGSVDDLSLVRETTKLPLLRKDFILDEYQLYESAAAGADALLLIVAALADLELAKLRRVTEEELGMDALVEVHTRDEMQRAVQAGANIIGVNNRNLATFSVTLETSIELAASAPARTVMISESGIETIDDIRRLRAAGYHGFLIGEKLMRAEHPEELLKELTQVCEPVPVSE
jgi:indole-3-glycerol phosphate synthase